MYGIMESRECCGGRWSNVPSPAFGIVVHSSAVFIYLLSYLQPVLDLAYCNHAPRGKRFDELRHDGMRCMKSFFLCERGDPALKARLLDRLIR